MVKAFAHAIIIPIIIAICTYYFINPTVTLLTPSAYLLLAFVMYAALDRKFPDYEGTQWFYYFVLIWLTMAVVLSVFIYAVHM